MDKKLIQGSEEWLNMRRKYIGASDAPIIMGYSPWKTAYQLWEEKLGLVKTEKANFAMERGNRLEPQALLAYNKLTGNFAEPMVVFSEEHKWMMSSLDGLSFDKKIIVEIKCPGKEDHDLASKGIIPKKYEAQLQHQLATIELDHLHYFSYHEESQYLVEVHRDEKFISKLISCEKCFWDSLQSLTPPDMTDRDVLEIEDDEFSFISNEWRIANEQLQKIKEKEDYYRKLLVEKAKNRNCNNKEISIRKIIRKGNIDYSKIPELEGKDLDQYRKSPSVSWRITMN